MFLNIDADVTSDFIRLIERYGFNNVKIAVKKVSGYMADNPRRSIEYVIGILRSKEEEGTLVDEEDRLSNYK